MIKSLILEISKNYVLFYPLRDSEVIWIPRSFITRRDSDVVYFFRRVKVVLQITKNHATLIGILNLKILTKCVLKSDN